MHGKESKIYVEACSKISSDYYNMIDKERSHDTFYEKIQATIEMMGCVGYSFADDNKKRRYYFENEDKRLRFILEYT